MAEEKSEHEKLMEFLADWGIRNDFKFVLPTEDEEKDESVIDYININLKTKVIYVDELGIDAPLTEVG